MRLLKFRVTNYRSISADTPITIDCGRFTSLVGANNTGKTSLLLALVAGMSMITSDKTTLRNQESVYFSDANLHESDDGTPPTSFSGISVLLVPTEAEASLITSPHSQGSPNGESIAEWVSRFGVVFTVDFSTLTDQTVRHRITQEDAPAKHWLDSQLTRQRWLNEGYCGGEEEFLAAMKRLASGTWKWLGSYEVISVEANRGGYPPQPFNVERRYESLIEYFPERQPGELANLIEALNIQARRGERRRFLEYVRMVVPEIESIAVRPDQLGDHVYIEQSGHEQPLYRSGSGITNVLYICARVLKSVRQAERATGVIVVDEPEAGLHPDLHRRLIRLAEAVHRDHGIQWVIGTHSPYFLLQTLGDRDRVTLTRLEAGKTTVTPIASRSDLDLLYESIGFYLPSMLAAQGVVCVEGLTELEFLRFALPSAGFDLERAGIVLI